VPGNADSRRGRRGGQAGAGHPRQRIGHNDAPWNSTTDSCDGAVDDSQGGSAVDWASYTGPCLAVVAGKLGANVSGILTEITRLRAGRPTLIRVTNFHNDNFLDPTVQRVVDAPTKAVVDAFGQAICGAAARRHLACADVYHAFNGPGGTRFDGRFVAADHVHPNQRGHTLIASLLVRLGYSPLRAR
jgi:lysophospholipase L1-like esterase